MRNIALFIVAFCVHACLYAQNKAATYVVRDSLTQVAVRSCRVMFDNKTTEHTTVTDDTGCFNSPVGATTVTISHVAYEPKQVDLRKLNGNTIYIVPKNVALKEATIGVTLYNLFSSKYDNNGWAAPQYRLDGSKLVAENTWGTRDSDAAGFAPSAPFHFMARLAVTF